MRHIAKAHKILKPSSKDLKKKLNTYNLKILAKVVVAVAVPKIQRYPRKTCCFISKKDLHTMYETPFFLFNQVK